MAGSDACIHISTMMGVIVHGLRQRQLSVKKLLGVYEQTTHVKEFEQADRRPLWNIKAKGKT